MPVGRKPSRSSASHGRGPDRHGQASESPLWKAVFEPVGAMPALSQQRDAPRSQGAERSAAVRDDLDASGEFCEARFELLEREGKRPGDVTSPVLLGRSQVEYDGITGLDPREELFSAHELDRIGITEVRAGRAIDLGKAVGRESSDCSEQVICVVAGEPVEDPGPFPASDDQAGTAEHLEVGGGQPDADLGACSQGLDASLPLRQQVEDLNSAGTGKGLAHPGELLVEVVLRRAIGRGDVTAIRWHGSPRSSDGHAHSAAHGRVF